MYKRKRFEDLTFSDDYMFCKVMSDKEICKAVIERLLDIQVDHIEYPELQKELKACYDYRGIRMDVYVKGSGKIYNIEMQNGHYQDLGLRVRYYQSVIDTDCLLQGEDYAELPESYILFICSRDPFGKGLQTYTFTNQCQEQESVSLDDSSKKIFYNASACESGKKQALNDFLRFVSKNEASDELTANLSGKITQIKREEKFRKEYMSMNIHECDIRREAKAEGRREGREEGLAEGREEGLAEGREEGREEGLLQGKEASKKETAENLLKMNILSLVQISQATGLPVERLKEIQCSTN